MQTQIEHVKCLNIKPTRDISSLDDDVRNSLLDRPRSLLPKYFYDARGSDLFAQICDTPEYYPTRTEESLLIRFGQDIITASQPQQIIELGSGNSQKTRHLFKACEDLEFKCSYAPFDVCKEILHDSSLALKQEYPWLNITPLVGDFHAGLGNIPDRDGRKLFIFLGGSIGNFSPEEATQFLTDLHETIEDGDYLLLGADRKKEHAVLNAAYNDAKGITAEFNLNILRVINNELNANFDIDAFEHSASFNDALDRIEMHLISRKDQVVEIDELDEQIRLNKGEKILTEISCKYSYEALERLIIQSGFSIEQHFQPENRYFSLVLARR